MQLYYTSIFNCNIGKLTEKWVKMDRSEITEQGSSHVRCKNVTKHCSWGISTSVSYLRGNGLKSRSTDQLTDWGYSWFLSVLSSKCQENTLHKATQPLPLTSFPIHYQSFNINHRIIQCYIVWATDSIIKYTTQKSAHLNLPLFH
jgi:hypothetical protein